MHLNGHARELPARLHQRVGGGDDLALEVGEGDEPLPGGEAGARGDAPDGLAADVYRRARCERLEGHLWPGAQRPQPPRHIRPARLEAGDQLLTRVATLGKARRRLDDARLERDRRVIELAGHPRLPRHDPRQLERPPIAERDGVGDLGALADQVIAAPRKRRAHEQARASNRSRRDHRAAQTNDERGFGGELGFDADLEATQTFQERPALAGLGVKDEGLRIDRPDPAQRLDFALHRQQQGEPGLADGQLRDVLGALALEVAAGVRAAQGDEVAAVDEGDRAARQGSEAIGERGGRGAHRHA